LLGGLGRLLLSALLHLLRAFLGDDDVALLRVGRVVGGFQRIRPALARRATGAGRIEFGAEVEGVRQRRVGLAVDRDRLVDVLAGVAIGVKIGLRRRALRLAGSFVIGEARRRRRKRDWEIAAVAGAHADRAEATGMRSHVAGPE